MNYSIDWDGPAERDRDPEEYELLRNRLAYALGGLRAVAAEAKDKKLSSIYGVAQGALDLAERGEQACAEMRGDTPMGPDAARMEFVDRISGTVDPGSEAGRLRTALQEIAGQNDLYGYTEADRPSAAYVAQMRAYRARGAGGSVVSIDTCYCNACRVAREKDAEIEQICAALEAVVSDIEDYERVNNLAPNPGRKYCWDSVAHAHTILAKFEKDPS